MISPSFYIVVITFLSLIFLVSSININEHFITDELGNYVRVAAIGDRCTPPSLECGDPNAFCIRKPHKLMGYCKCRPEFYFDRKSFTCVRSIAIGDPCSESRECLSFDRHSYCDFAQLVRKRRPICACQSKYVYNHEKQRCVHCRSTLTDCRDPSTSTSASSLARYKFALLIKIILIVIGFSLLLSLTFCFFIKILNGYSKSRRSALQNRTTTTTTTNITTNQPIITTQPPPQPLQPLPLSSSSFHPFPPLPPPIPPTNDNQLAPLPPPPPPGINHMLNDRDNVQFPPLASAPPPPLVNHSSSKNGRSISSNLTTNQYNSNSSNNNDQRFLFLSSSDEDKPPSYEEAVHESIPCKRNLLISLNPNSPLKGNPV